MVSAVPGSDASLTPPSVRAAVAESVFADVRWVAETGSTNADLADLAATGAPEGVVLVADHQTAGRGRLGRTWTAPVGSSLLLSVLLRPALPVGHAHALSTAVALAAREACEAVAGVTASLKWPNDLVVAVPPVGGAEGQLPGGLAESTLRGEHPGAGAVGIGLSANLPHELPDEIADIATALNHLTGAAVDRADLLAALLLGLDRRYATLRSPGGRAALREEEHGASATLGRRVRVLRAHDELEGVAVGFEDDGALRLEVDTDVLVVPVGDVVHLRA